MLATELVQEALNLKAARVTGVRVAPQCFVATVRPDNEEPICSGCLAGGPVYDTRRARNWRTLDLCGAKLLLECDVRRVDCKDCGPTTELVPWADPGCDFTYDFERQTAYLAQRCDKTTVSKLMRIGWPTVGNIIERVVRRFRSKDPLDDLLFIGVDELSYRKHHEYLTVVVNLGTGEVVWAHPGKNADTLTKFFEELGEARRKKLQLVAIDLSKAYKKAAKEWAPNARLVFDRFHVQRLVHDALDSVRRQLVRETGLNTVEGQALKRTRWALQKNPWNLTELESQKLALLQRANKPLYRAYLLKESLAAILDRRQVHVAKEKLVEWISWAMRSRLEPFKKAATTIREHLDGILAYVATGFSNGRTEGLNGKIRTITRRSFGFHRPESLIALIFLSCSGLRLSPAHVARLTP